MPGFHNTSPWTRHLAAAIRFSNLNQKKAAMCQEGLLSKLHYLLQLISLLHGYEAARPAWLTLFSANHWLRGLQGQPQLPPCLPTFFMILSRPRYEAQGQLHWYIFLPNFLPIVTWSYNLSVIFSQPGYEVTRPASLKPFSAYYWLCGLQGLNHYLVCQLVSWSYLNLVMRPQGQLH